MSDESVRVAVRVRPLSQGEQERGCRECVERVRGQPQIRVNGELCFTFNYVFDQHSTQVDLYQECVAEMLDKLFCGFNGTILAYGQTGSGKTYTMGTAYEGGTSDNVGVIPRAMHNMFERIGQLSDEYDFKVTCSFMELYQEHLYDLLSTKGRDQSMIELREDRNGIVLSGLIEQEVYTARETTDCLMRGSSGRAVASTAMNTQSSRSHAIFTVTLQATQRNEIKTVTTSKFHLVDLAGSERCQKTQATGDRFKEGVKINQGLLALGNVISALGSQNPGFVPYRDSKLTRLLQDSLGGNSITLMIACVSPADYNVNETLSTLRYADRARKIKNKPIVNQDPHAAEINRLNGIIEHLRGELAAAGGSSTVSFARPPKNRFVAKLPDPALEGRLYQELKVKYKNLQEQLQSTLHSVVEIEMRAHIAEAAHEKLKTQTEGIKLLVSELETDLEIEDLAQMKESARERVQHMHQLFAGIEEIFANTASELADNHRNSHENDSTVSDDDIKEIMQEQVDVYTSKQVGFNEQLRRINRELDIKEQLCERVAGNLTQICTLDDQTEAKFKECESKIQELEEERNELMNMLKIVKDKTSAKLAEERRKRVQALELEINEIKRKNSQQAQLLKVREKEAQKIVNLKKEIQQMKESRVKLIRSMHSESQTFRQWKLNREKELMQLKSKDLKMQSEMARKDALHTKQHNVLKRKCEEAMAVNKRLKDALERQREAKLQRQKFQSSKNVQASATKVSQLISWIGGELDVIMSVIDGEQSLKQLKEDRAIICQRMAPLEATHPPDNTPAAQELLNLKEDLKARNTQINELQQKVNGISLEKHITALCEGIQNVEEARTILNHTLKTLSEMRREFAQRSNEQKAAIEGERTGREAAEERYTLTAKKMDLMQQEHENALSERENAYEEKIGLLLRQLNSKLGSGESSETVKKIEEEYLDKVEDLRAQLEQYKSNLATSSKNKTKKRKSLPEEYPDIEESITVSDESDFGDSGSDDPDWIKTPMYARRKRNRGLFHDDSQSSKSDKLSGAGRQMSTRCTCRGDCSTKRCGCDANGRTCSVRCGCGSALCKNGRNEDNVGPDASASGSANATRQKDPLAETEEHQRTLLTKDKDLNRFTTYETPRKKFFE